MYIASPVPGRAQARLAVSGLCSCGQTLLLEGVQRSWGWALPFLALSVAQIPAPTLGNSYSLSFLLLI